MRIAFRRPKPKVAPKRIPPPAPKPPCERCRKIREAAKRLIGMR
ncbi:MAG: hypothetical protein ACK5PG_05875 [Lysobacterales bacterium]|jgi:hypothetical protein